MDRTWEIALSGLLHDVGKFFQRATSEKATEVNLHEFCPPDPKAPDRRTHHHAAYTAQFIETYLSWLSLKGRGDLNPMVWAARHHKPSSALDWIVAEADRLSAGMDRGHPDESARGWDQVRKRRLVPLLSRLQVSGKGGDTESARVCLKRLEVNRDALFPIPQDPEGINLEEATQEYAALWEGFKQDLTTLPHGDLRSFFVSFLFLYEKWAWCVPAATNIEVSDVSLFEHSKTAAAIAVCLYEQLGGDGDEERLLENEIENRTLPRYLLACGDLSGIQQFIYTVKHEHAARALRGRSFALQLLTDAIAQSLLMRFDLPPCNLLYAGGGKFWVLLPRNREEELKQFGEEIDRFLLAEYRGQISFCVGRAVVTGEDFVLKRIGGKWAEVAQDLIETRRHRLARSVKEDYAAVFAPFGRGAVSLCDVCGNELQEGEEGSCQSCKTFEQLGAALTRAKTIVRWEGKVAQARALDVVRQGEGRAFFLPAPFSVAYAVLPNVPDQISTADSPCVFVVNSTDFFVGSQEPIARGFWFLGRNRPEDEAGKVQTYEDLAKKSFGVKRLGVLRMDVDNLGSLLEQGFGPEEASISRLTAFSKHLTYFFGGYLQYLIIGRMGLGDHVQIVYSGGDDLFLVGAWSDLPRLAKTIRDEFQAFAGGNPVLTISGGLALVRQKFPLARAAALAAELEEAAKGYQRNGQEKDALGIFDPEWVLGWHDLVVAAAIARDLVAWVGPGLSISWDNLLPLHDLGKPQGRLPRGILHPLMQIGGLYKQHEAELRKRHGKKSLEEIDALIHKGRWTWTATYSLSQLAERVPEARSFLADLQDALLSRNYRSFCGDKPPIDIIDIAARWADYLTRKEEV